MDRATVFAELDCVERALELTLAIPRRYTGAVRDYFREEFEVNKPRPSLGTPADALEAHLTPFRFTLTVNTPTHSPFHMRLPRSVSPETLRQCLRFWTVRDASRRPNAFP